MESITELRGIWVVELEQGMILGKVSGMTIDPRTAIIATLVYQTKKGPKQKFFVPKEQIEKIGRDVVLLKSNAGTAIDKVEEAPGISLKELQGCWVTTQDGKRLGTLLDIDFSASDWRVSELELSEGKHFAVEADKLKIGDDILVPAEYEKRLKDMPKERYGAMGRLLGVERIDDLRGVIQKAVKKGPKKPEKEV